MHVVAEARDYLRVRAALRGESQVPTGLLLDASLRRERAETPSKD